MNKSILEYQYKVILFDTKLKIYIYRRTINIKNLFHIIFSICGRVVEGSGLIIRILIRTPLVRTQPDADYLVFLNLCFKRPALPIMSRK